MARSAEFTDIFKDWWNGLSEDEQVDVDAKVRLLETLERALARPHADSVHGSRQPNRKELRIQHGGRTYRALFASDPWRAAILPLGGDKTGNANWYDENIPIADRLFDEHLRTIRDEGTRHGKKF